MGSVVTPAQAAQRLSEWDRGMLRANVNAIRRGQGRLLTKSIARLNTIGMARRIWGLSKGKKSNVRKSVFQSKVRVSGDTITGGLEARGIPALIEVGGKTRAHIIRPKSAKLLVFPARGGGLVFTKLVKHPGSRVPRHPWLAPTVAAGLGDIAAEAEKASAAHATKVLG